jgi:hypothetical protein
VADAPVALGRGELTVAAAEVVARLAGLLALAVTLAGPAVLTVLADAVVVALGTMHVAVAIRIVTVGNAVAVVVQAVATRCTFNFSRVRCPTVDPAVATTFDAFTDSVPAAGGGDNGCDAKVSRTVASRVSAIDRVFTTTGSTAEAAIGFPALHAGAVVRARHAILAVTGLADTVATGRALAGDAIAGTVLAVFAGLADAIGVAGGGLASTIDARLP